MEPLNDEEKNAINKIATLVVAVFVFAQFRDASNAFNMAEEFVKEAEAREYDLISVATIFKSLGA